MKRPIKRWSLLFFALAGGVFLVVAGRGPWKQSSVYASDRDYDPEERIHCWVLSAQCARQRHAFLSLSGPDGKLYPIENCTYADDRGHALLANVMALFQDHPFDRTDLVRMNMLINGVGVWVLSLLFWLIEMPWAAALCVLFGSKYALPGPIPGPDVPSAYLGIVSLSLTAVVWASQNSLWNRSREAWGLGLGISGLSLGAAYLMRSPIGLAGLVVSEAFLVRRLSYRSLAAALVLALILGWTPVLLTVRNRLYGLTSSPFGATHGVSQTLFHGLGTEPNPFGIRWDDQFGIEYVRRQDPTVPYLSPSYYRILRRAYGSLVFHHPVAVARIYGIKLRKVLAFPFQWGGIGVYWYAAGTLLLIGFQLNRAPPAECAPLYAGLGVLGFLGIFLLQGVLGIPWGKHLYPVKWIVLLGIGCLADYGVGRWAIRARFKANP